MELELPEGIASRIGDWSRLSSWERAELGRDIRRRGWSYGEIMTVIPVPKSTLSNWCRGISLTSVQKQAIFERTGSRRGIPRDTQRKRRQEVNEIRAAAFGEVPHLITNPLWLAGTVMYWAEGNKTGRQLGLANSDPRALRLFVDWTRQHHDPAAEFVLKLNLHEGNDEKTAKSFWEAATGLSGVEFYRTYLKPEGTGHRKNHLANGVCLIRVRRSSNAWIRTLAWVDALAEEWTVGTTAILSPGSLAQFGRAGAS